MNLKKLLLIFFFNGLWMPLSSAQDMAVTSIPSGAKVYLLVDQEREELGESPIKMTLDEVKSFTNGQNIFNLVIEKEGFTSETVYLSNLGSNNIEVELELLPEYSSEHSKKIDELINKLFEAQRLVRSKNFKDALELLTEVEKDHKDFSAVYELKGGAYYLNKEMKKSLSYFRKAFDTNPENKDAYKMKKYLENILGAKQ